MSQLHCLVPGSPSPPQQWRKIEANTEGKRIQLEMNTVRITEVHINVLPRAEIKVRVETVVAVNRRVACRQCIVLVNAAVLRRSSAAGTFPDDAAVHFLCAPRCHVVCRDAERQRTPQVKSGSPFEVRESSQRRVRPAPVTRVKDRVCNARAQERSKSPKLFRYLVRPVKCNASCAQALRAITGRKCDRCDRTKIQHRRFLDELQLAKNVSHPAAARSCSRGCCATDKKNRH